RIRIEPLGFIQRAVDQYGDFCRFRIGSHWLFIVNRPDLAEELLTARAASFHKGRALEHARDVLGNGLLTSEGDFHLRQRRTMAPLFHHKRVAAYADIMGEVAARHAGRWAEGEPMDLHRAMVALTLDVVGRTLFGLDLEGDARRVGDALA